MMRGRIRAGFQVHTIQFFGLEARRLLQLILSETVGLLPSVFVLFQAHVGILLLRRRFVVFLGGVKSARYELFFVRS